MAFQNSADSPFTVRFIDAGPNILLELMNTSDQQIKCVEILTVFLKGDESAGGQNVSRAHIKFEPIKAIRPQEKIVFSHKTWIDGKPVAPTEDKLESLKVLAGGAKPYVLDISWETVDGKSRYQRIPVGH